MLYYNSMYIVTTLKTNKYIYICVHLYLSKMSKYGCNSMQKKQAIKCTEKEKNERVNIYIYS